MNLIISETIIMRFWGFLMRIIRAIDPRITIMPVLVLVMRRLLRFTLVLTPASLTIRCSRGS